MNWIWLSKTFIQVKLFFIFWIVCPIHFLSQWWQLNGFSQVRILSCTLRFQGLTEQTDFISWLDSTSDWINDLNAIVYIHASEQQILIKMRTTKSLRNLRIFCPLLGTVHYWGLLLNKNGWEAGFCPLLGAFPLLGSALLGEYSVFPILPFRRQTNLFLGVSHPFRHCLTPLGLNKWVLMHWLFGMDILMLFF